MSQSDTLDSARSGAGQSTGHGSTNVTHSVQRHCSAVPELRATGGKSGPLIMEP